MKVGDLVKVTNVCGGESDCTCWYCYTGSSMIGIVIEERGGTTEHWDVMFDAGPWMVYDGEAEVISEGR